jgi:imidazolonepropionase
VTHDLYLLARTFSQSGGGIGFTVNHTRAASEADLLTSLLGRLDRALRLGTTLLEAKSGYGLELETELKMLKVIQQAHDMHPVDLVANYCGGHSVPKGSTASEATHDIIHHQLPEIMRAKAGLGLTSLELIDVFMEKGVFEGEDTKLILKAGQAAGLGINFHGDELSAIQAAELGAELNATAISHLEHVRKHSDTRTETIRSECEQRTQID